MYITKVEYHKTCTYLLKHYFYMLIIIFLIGCINSL